MTMSIVARITTNPYDSRPAAITMACAATVPYLEPAIMEYAGRLITVAMLLAIDIPLTITIGLDDGRLVVIAMR